MPKGLRIGPMHDSNFATNPDDSKTVNGKIITLDGAITNWGPKTQPTIATNSKSSSGDVQHIATSCYGFRSNQSS